ncbi:MAG TPA: DNA-processing protein DprA [Fimbriimonas sp.]|nr:DNA-processing protein DprA [Fimbriimonas sp.]
MTSSFWQCFLAAELTPQKSRAVLDGLGSFVGDPIDYLLKKAPLSDAEKRRVVTAQASNIDPFLASGVRLMVERDFPELLQEALPPPALFAWGNADFDRPTIAIVGTRNASTYGKACAQKFAESFARAGVTVVSGGALGIDGAAHQGALKGEGQTIAVLAGGVDHVYPSMHAGLFRQIRESGSLVSQFALESRPSPYKFTVRNGLIAALSLAVLVVEAPAKSGAIRTAEAASELGRQVFVVPANINMMSFHGSFNLIRDGATLVDNPNQVLEALDLEPALLQPELAPASSTGEKIMSVLSTNPLAAEFIVERTGLDTGSVLAELTLLELEGHVIRDGSGYALRP